MDWTKNMKKQHQSSPHHEHPTTKKGNHGPQQQCSFAQIQFGKNSTKHASHCLPLSSHRFYAILFVLFSTLILLVHLLEVWAVPAGPTFDSITGSFANRTAGTARPDDTKGYIYYTNITVSQQSTKWKAYIGDVSGKITLDDANNYTIFNWDTGTVEGGNVFATRSATPSWNSIQCLNSSVLTSEETRLRHDLGSQGDKLTTTFLANTNHQPFIVSSLSFTSNTCNYTLTTFVNSTAQPAASRNYTEVALMDNSTTEVVYMALLNTTENIQGYNTSFFDFQMLVPENGTSSTATLYYFYLELI